MLIVHLHADQLPAHKPKTLFKMGLAYTGSAPICSSITAPFTQLRRNVGLYFVSQVAHEVALGLVSFVQLQIKSPKPEVCVGVGEVKPQTPSRVSLCLIFPDFSQSSEPHARPRRVSCC